MCQWWLLLLCLLWLPLCARAQDRFTQCKIALREVVHAIPEFNGVDLAVGRPYPPTHRSILEAGREEREVLKQSRVPFRTITEKRKRGKGWKTALEYFRFWENGFEWPKGTLLKITKLPPGTSTDIYGGFLNHVESADIYRDLVRMGYSLVVDSGLAELGLAGLANYNGRLVHVRATTSFKDLVHEWAHVRFEHYGVFRLLERVEEGESWDRLCQAQPVVEYGRERLNQLKKLYDLGLRSSLNEVMAVQEEFNVAVKYKQTRRLVQDRGYALGYVLSELIQLSRTSELSDEQVKILVSAYREYRQLHPDTAIPGQKELDDFLGRPELPQEEEPRVLALPSLAF